MVNALRHSDSGRAEMRPHGVHDLGLLAHQKPQRLSSIAPA